MRVVLLTILLAITACNEQREGARSFVGAEWNDGIPEQVDITQLGTDFMATDFPGADFDGDCGRASHFVAREEPRAYWIRCEFVPGAYDLFLYELDRSQVTETLTMMTMLSTEG